MISGVTIVSEELQMQRLLPKVTFADRACLRVGDDEQRAAVNYVAA